MTSQNGESCKEVGTLSFFMDHVPEVFLKKAETELHETDESRVAGLKELKEMIKTKQTLDGIEFHEDYLQLLLRHSKYDVDRTFNRLQNVVSFKTKYKFYFDSISNETFSELLSENFITVLPKRCRDGCAIVLLEYGKWDMEKVSLDDFQRYCMMILLQCMRDPVTQITGFKFIHDWKNTSLWTYRQFTPSVLYVAFQAFYHCFPARFKEIHGFNEPVTFKVLWAIVKPLLNEKLTNRIFVHSKPEELLEHFPASVIPSKYGGDLTENEISKAMTDWNIKAREQHELSTLGGQCNFY